MKKILIQELLEEISITKKIALKEIGKIPLLSPNEEAELAQRIIDGDYSVLLEYDNDLAKRLYVYLMEGYRPKVIIEYDRIAYITSTTTRITFDFNIKRSCDFEKFFTNEINYYDVVDGKDVVLEVKFDRFLEPYISKILNNYVGRYQSVSKYMMGRNV